MTENTSDKAEEKSLNFIEQIVVEDLEKGKHKTILTRFPPEPNGYLHIGHAKSIILNFELAKKYGGKTNLRFDDTNPTKEETEYVDSIKKDIQWLGYTWQGEEKYTSDYFEKLYLWAEKIIQAGKAYIDDQPAELISKQRGTPTRPGQESPYRKRSIDENLRLFRQMRAGDFKDGEKVLRAKIDMSSPNMQMRDPILYRIVHSEHHRTGNKWCIYPMYDFAHGQSDYIEGITHSLCTLEFRVHRPLYDWCLDQIYEKNTIRPQQIEFARLNINYTVMSKRKLLQLVEDKLVNSWDDPRMPTISGLRRRGYTPKAIRNFAERVGIAKRDNIIDIGLLEFSVREDLNKKALRMMAVLRPLKLIIDNYPEGKTEYLETDNNPEDENAGKRKMPFSKVLYIEQDDFMEEPPKKYFRLTIGKEIRLKSAYIIKGESIEKDKAGNITAIHCSYDPESRSGSGSQASKRKVKGTLHWVSVQHAINAEVRLYDRLFNDENPTGHENRDFKEFINPHSLEILTDSKLEPALAEANISDKFQFQRIGYFCLDKDTTKEKLVFNRTVGLRDSWTKKNKK